MKPSHYLRMLRYDPLVTLACLSFGAWFAWTDLTSYANKDDVSFHFHAGGLFIYFLIAMALPFIFNAPLGGARSQRGIAADSELEFLFTRAISRRTVFYAKASRYLLVCIFPILIAWVYACDRPQVRVQLAYDHEQRAGMEQFYLSHFPGSHVQTDPADEMGNIKAYVVLPRGRMNRAFSATAWVCFTAFLYQLVIFLFWRKRGAAMTIFFLFACVPNFWLFSMESPRSESIMTPFVPTLYETNLGWMTMHVPLTLLILGLLAIATQTYSCRRYINTEVTS